MKNQPEEMLKGWVLEYIKHKDIFLKSIVSIKENKKENIINIKYKKENHESKSKVKKRQCFS